MPKNVGDLGKLIVSKGLKTYPKSNKLPNLVTLLHFSGTLSSKNLFFSIFNTPTASFSLFSSFLRGS